MLKWILKDLEFFTTIYKEKNQMIDQDNIKEIDSHWNEVMDLAVKYGFITYAYGGTAILVTHANQLKEYGEEKYRQFQKNRFGRKI